jgi:hypothetical protein
MARSPRDRRTTGARAGWITLACLIRYSSRRRGDDDGATVRGVAGPRLRRRQAVGQDVPWHPEGGQGRGRRVGGRGPRQVCVAPRSDCGRPAHDVAGGPGRRVAADDCMGPPQLVDLDPLRVDAWLVQMRRRGVGAGAIRGRVSTLKADLPGVSGRDSSRVFWDRFGAVGLRPDPSLRADSARGQARRCADMGVRVSCCSGRLVLVFCGFLVCYRLVGGGWGAVQHQQGADHSGGAEDDEWPVMLGCAEHCPT